MEDPNWIEELRAEQNRLWADWERRWGAVPDVGNPLPGTGGTGAIDSVSRTKQVGMKLSAEDYARLKNAADLYGCAPSTLARILVNKAVRSVLSAEGVDAE